MGNTNGRLRPLKGDLLLCELMRRSAAGDSAATNCMDMVDEDATVTDDTLRSAYNNAPERAGNVL